MRDVDTEIVEWAMQYAPFAAKVLENRKHCKCDFCGEPSATKIVRLSCEDKEAPLYSCFGCSALVTLLGQEKTSVVCLFAMVIDTGLANDAAMTEAEIEAQRIQNFIVTSKPDSEIKGLVKTAKHYLSLGLGSNWRIIPDIIQQHESGRTLTVKQINCIEKFIASCDSVFKRSVQSY